VSSATRIELLRFVMPNSERRDDITVPTFKPPFDMIWKLAHAARKVGCRGAVDLEAIRPVLLPGIDSSFSV